MRDYQGYVDRQQKLAKKLGITMEQLMLIEITSSLKQLESELKLIKLTIGSDLKKQQHL